MEDMDVLEFARKISMLTIDTPLSNEYDEKYGQDGKRWWSCQREHLTVWCLHYPTEGVEGFNHTPSNSAKAMYNSFGRPETLLWLSEALGENEDILKSVIGDIKDTTNCRTACKKIREKIPFNRIMELINGNHEN